MKVQAAAALEKDPEEFTLYSLEKKMTLMKQFRLKPDGAGKISVYKKIWQGNPGVYASVMPPLLAYAELMNTGDRRSWKPLNKCMNTYKIDFNRLRQDENLSDMLSALERDFVATRLTFILSGL